MTSPPPAADPRPHAGVRELLLLGGSALVLTVLAAVVGALGWPTPARTLSGWQVADVPGTLLVLVGVAAVVCSGTAAALARPWTWRAPLPAAVWWSLGAVAVFALGWTALYFAALGTSDDGPVIPVLDWLYSFVPALGAALATKALGRDRQLRAGLSTTIVTVPLLALGWALYGGGSGSVGGAVLGALYAAGLLGAAPAAAALALAVRRNPRRDPTG